MKPARKLHDGRALDASSKRFESIPVSNVTESGRPCGVDGRRASFPREVLTKSCADLAPLLRLEASTAARMRAAAHTVSSPISSSAVRLSPKVLASSVVNVSAPSIERLMDGSENGSWQGRAALAPVPRPTLNDLFRFPCELDPTVIDDAELVVGMTDAAWGSSRRGEGDLNE